MANVCKFCEKGRLVGNKVSHSNIKTKKVQRANIQKVKAVDENGSAIRVRTCTRCLRSGKVQKRVA